MLATIWTSASGTTGAINEDVSMKEYYQGATFRPAAILDNKLKEFCKTRLYILLDDGEYVEGSTPSTILSDQTNIQCGFGDKFINSLGESDVTVVLLASAAFNEYVATNWDHIVENAKPDSIWCLGASKGSLEKIDIQKLENKGCKVLLYERSGVAPIGTDIRDQLLKQIQNRVS
jgi:hypothetical protein